MKEIRVLTGRTMKLYLKNPLSILFSFVYMLLFIVLISLFLGDYMTKGMMDVYAEVERMDFSHICWLVDTTSMAGVLMINCILVPLNVLTIMVQDSNDNRLDSFLVSAVARNKLVGFLTGAFLPIGIFPANIQKIFSLVPAHHGATLMRRVMTREPLMATFGNVTDQTVKGTYMTAKEIIDIYASENGITYMFGNVQFPFSAMLIIVIGSGLLFMAFSIIWMEHYKKH